MRSLALVILMLCATATPCKLKAQTQETTEQVVKKCSDAVVLIFVSDSGKETGLGSGFIISSDGKIVTNYHVIKDAQKALVKLTNGAFFPVESVLASDSVKDLAIIKVTGKNLPTLKIADSDTAQVGERVIAIGSPLGLESTVTDGIVSALRNEASTSWIQTTAPVSPGNSGGPLLRLDGTVVGVITWGYKSGQNLNFASPSNYVRDLINAETKEVVSLTTSVDRGRLKAPDRSPKELVTSAKTLCVWVTSGNPVLKTELSGKLLEWGKLKLVSSPEEADLVLKVVQTGQLNMATGAGNQATALLTDHASGSELWSKTKGGSWAMSGWSNTAVARALAKEFIKFFDSTKRQPHE